MKRRDFLTASSLALIGLPLLRMGVLRAADGRAATQPFDYAALKGRARAMAERAYAPAPTHIPKTVSKLGWDQFTSIRYLPEHALWAGDALRFRLQFFHLGMQFEKSVRLNEVVDGKTRAIIYDPAVFDLARSGLAPAELPPDLGFAGFRLFASPDFDSDVAAFLGASYFRAVGASKQYGLSARGLAVDCGMPRAEEFPDFTEFWFERPQADAQTLIVYALLDSPSIAGAYRFEIETGEPLVMRIDAALYARTTIERLGVAPLTSMFLTAPHDRRAGEDWRPAIHDSEGLALWTRGGEWIWRPLVNPPALRVSSFLDDGPRGFGLLQRDRNFDHYQDDGVWYDRRPSAWVEPLSGFGKGAVQLVEIPIAHESFDNIVAFWNPAEKPRAGDEHLYAYRLHWGAKMPAAPTLAETVATWSGIGGQVGGKREHFSWRFVVDFAGGNLGAIGKDASVEAIVTTSRGTAEHISVRALASVKGYRATFDVRPPDGDAQPIDIRLFLRSGVETLSETWLYQWNPPAKPPALAP